MGAQATLYPSIITSTLATLLRAILPGIPKKVKVSLTNAQVLASGTAILCIAAPGAGYAIRVLRASIAMYGGQFNAYATHTQMALYTTAAYPQMNTVSTFLSNSGAASDAHQFFNTIAAATGEDNPIAENAALYVKTLGGNPTGGTSPVDIYISYEIIAL